MNTVKDYIESLEQPTKGIFEDMYKTVKTMVPDATEGKSYGMAAFIYKDKGLVAFVAAKDHLSLFPMSGSVVGKLQDKLAAYDVSKGTIRFSTDNIIPPALLKEIINCRLQEIAEGKKYS